MDENRKLREDVLPLITQAKNRSQPLPTPEERDFAAAQAPEVVQPKSASGGLSRKFSTKRIFLGNGGPKNPSPTTINETQPLSDPSSINSSAAALVASNHLTANLRDVSSPNQVVPSPTSPAYQIQPPPSSTGPPQRGFARTESLDRDAWNTTFASAPDRSRSAMDNPPLSGGGQVKTPGSTTGSTSGGQGSSGAPSRDQVEIFKSFRVSIDDPCHKVLPVALKKYNITADWRQYALYIVHGDQERCLGLNEKPLILFKQLDREGRKPMFMVSRSFLRFPQVYTMANHTFLSSFENTQRHKKVTTRKSVTQRAQYKYQAASYRKGYSTGSRRQSERFSYGRENGDHQRQRNHEMHRGRSLFTAGLKSHFPLLPCQKRPFTSLSPNIAKQLAQVLCIEPAF